MQRWRDWFPLPRSGKIDLIRWILVEGNRIAVTAMLLSFVFVSLMSIGTFWTFEMQRLLVETPAVQTILNTLLGGIILLVSIVVSINSIVLSHDLTTVGKQEDRLENVMQFRRDIGRLTETGTSPTDPISFLQLMADVIAERAEKLEQTVHGHDQELVDEISEDAEEIIESIDSLNRSFEDAVRGAELSVLWHAYEVNDSHYLERSRMHKTTYQNSLSEDVEERLDDLIEALNLFTVGREHFKTLYYSQEVAELSRTLLVIALPAILINSSAILAINAEILPEYWIFGLPPLQSFVATVFTLSLAPYLVLTAYTLRLATVAKRTANTGPFSLQG